MRVATGSIYLGPTRDCVERRLADRIKTSSVDIVAFGVFAAAAAATALKLRPNS